MPLGRSWSLVLVALGLSFAPPARAGNSELKKACVAAADKGQELRSESKLSAARDQFVRCSRDECPAPLRQDCAQWMNEVVSALPSVVIGARDAAGHDLVQVSVTIDGVKVADSLDGKPIPLDPGPHKFRYEQADGGVVEEEVLVRQGEKNRALTATFGKATGGAGSAPPATEKKNAAVETKATETSGSSTPAMAWVFGGLGVVALGTAAYFDLSANSRVLDLRGSCAPNCAQSDVDAVRRRYTIAGVAAGVGVVSLGVATYLFLHKPSSSSETPPAQARFHFDFAPAPNGASAALSGSF